MVQLRCTICAKSWQVAYFGDVRSEQQKHDQDSHADIVRRQEALFEELSRLMPNAAAGEPGRCSFCNSAVADRAGHERESHPAEFSRASELAGQLKELDRHWHVTR
jgi:hypothetical protein